MPSEAKDKFSFILKCSLAFALVVAAAMFSVVFDWHESTILISATGNTVDTWGEPCKDTAKATPAKTTAEVLKPLDPNEEELVVKDRVLASAEVLGLNEGIDKLENLGKPKTSEPTAAPSAQAPPTEKTTEATTQNTLPAPENATPQKAADVRKHRFVRLHWDAVPGAKTYEVKAWQLDGAKKIAVADAKTGEVELRVEPQIQGAPLHWQVSAVDDQGRSGQTAGPITIDLLNKAEARRLPAASGRSWWPRR